MNAQALAQPAYTEHRSGTIGEILSFAFARTRQNYLVVLAELGLFGIAVAIAAFTTSMVLRSALAILQNDTVGYILVALHSLALHAVALCGTAAIGLRAARGDLKIGDAFRALRSAHRMVPNALAFSCLVQCGLFAFAGCMANIFKMWFARLGTLQAPHNAVLENVGPLILVAVTLILVVVSAALWMVPYLALDTDMKLRQAAQESARMMRDNFGTFVLILIVSLVGFALAALTCGLSFVVTYPFNIVLGGCFYTMTRQQQGAPRQSATLA
jgi:hypothetical protein